MYLTYLLNKELTLFLIFLSFVLLLISFMISNDLYFVRLGKCLSLILLRFLVSSESEVRCGIFDTDVSLSISFRLRASPISSTMRMSSSSSIWPKHFASRSLRGPSGIDISLSCENGWRHEILKWVFGEIESKSRY